MKISTIIPVYNAEEFIVLSVESALKHKEILEVILVEDGSTDGSLAICHKLEKNHEKVTLYTHAENANLGASASRNLGMRKAQYDYISFLDADDIYLENRFDRDREIFRENPEAEIVGNAIGSIDSNGEITSSIEDSPDLKKFTSICQIVDPGDMAYVLNDMHPHSFGYFHLNGITIKRSAIEKVGMFDNRLRLHQDTHWLLGTGWLLVFYPGEINQAVALRRYHPGNRITNDRSSVHSSMLYQAILETVKEKAIGSLYRYKYEYHLRNVTDGNKFELMKYMFLHKVSLMYIKLKLTLR